jgi:chromosome segregation ATPase
LYKNRGKPRNAYSELLIGEIIKLQKSNSRLREKVQSSTQVLLTQEEVKDQKKFMNRPLEIIEEKEEGFEHQEDHLGRTKCTKECNEMFEKIQEQNKELESQLKELKNEISALKNMEKNQYSELNNFKMKNKELNDELLILKGCNPESTVKIAEENSKIHEKLSKITEENLKLTEKFSKTTKENSELKEALVKISGDLKNNEECLKSLEKQSKRDEETLLSHKKTLSGENSISKSGFEQENPDINAIHKHYYELITAEAHAIKSYEDLMNFRLEELHGLYSSTVDKYNQDIHQKIHLKIETLQNEIKTLKGKLMETSHEIQEKNKDLELKKSEIQAKNNELFAKNQEINGKTQELDNLNLKMNEAQKHFEFEKSHELKRRFTKALEKEKSIFKSELDEKSSIIKQLEQKVFYLNSQITDLKEKINKTEDELAKVQVNFTELKGKYAMLKKMATSH